MRAGWIAALAVAGALAWGWSQRQAAPEPVAAPQATPATQAAPAGQAARWPAFLPAEAVATLRRIEAGGPFEYRQDGAVFQNRERRLPQQPRGYYREYTVATPGSRDRGARRIVGGGGGEQARPVEYFYTDDHYRSFRRFVPRSAQ